MSANTLVIALAMMLLAGCGSDPEVATLLVTDQCEYSGPEGLVEGSARLTLQRTGLGDYGAALVSFGDGHDASELESHFSGVSPDWEQRPEWAKVAHLITVNDDDVESPTGDTVIMDLDAGDYAVVCINFSDRLASVAANLQVLPDGS